MRRPQFSVKSLLYLMAVIGALCAAWPSLKPPIRKTMNFDDSSVRQYIWRNGLSVTISLDRSKLPSIKIETGADTSVLDLLEEPPQE